MNKIKNMAYESAKNNGFYDHVKIEDCMMGIVSEIVEAWQSKENIETPLSIDTRSLSRGCMDNICDTVEMEIVDIQLRLLSLAGYLNIDLTPTNMQEMIIRTTADKILNGSAIDLLLVLLQSISKTYNYDYKQFELTHSLLIIPIMVIEEWCNYNDIDIKFLRELKLQINKERGFLHGKNKKR